MDPTVLSSIITNECIGIREPAHIIRHPDIVAINEAANRADPNNARELSSPTYDHIDHLAKKLQQTLDHPEFPGAINEEDVRRIPSSLHCSSVYISYLKSMRQYELTSAAFLLAVQQCARAYAPVYANYVANDGNFEEDRDLNDDDDEEDIEQEIPE
jgi:hypothetical protein